MANLWCSGTCLDTCRCAKRHAVLLMWAAVRLGEKKQKTSAFIKWRKLSSTVQCLTINMPDLSLSVSLLCTWAFCSGCFKAVWPYCSGSKPQVDSPQISPLSFRGSWPLQFEAEPTVTYSYLYSPREFRNSALRTRRKQFTLALSPRIVGSWKSCSKKHHLVSTLN